MNAAAEYRRKAAELAERAKADVNPSTRIELEALAASYLRLAEQAMRNNQNDIVYETPVPRPAAAQQQQQQQQQPQQPQTNPEKPE